MFTEAGRAAIRTALLDKARADESILAAAIVGSAAAAAGGREDRWSDIDLALRLAPGQQPLTVADRWTAELAGIYPLADQLDVWAEQTLYRVLLLSDSLQIDVSFWPDQDFAGTGEPFRLVFGPPPYFPDPGVPEAGQDRLDREIATGLIRTGWLHALHVRSAIRRDRPLQAVLMLDGLRAALVELCCLAHDLPRHHGRGVDRLPADLVVCLLNRSPFSGAWARTSLRSPQSRYDPVSLLRRPGDPRTQTLLNSNLFKRHTTRRSALRHRAVRARTGGPGPGVRRRTRSARPAGGPVRSRAGPTADRPAADRARERHRHLVRTEAAGPRGVVFTGDADAG